MDITKFEPILVIASLLMPGFITATAFRMVVPSKDLIDQRGILTYLTFTALDYAVLYWIIVVTGQISLFSSHPVRAVCIWVFVFLIGPAIVGFIFGAIWQNNLIRRAFLRIGLRVIHHIPNSWDYLFDSIREPSWILITLQDGQQIAGIFGTKSFASSDIAERDLYIEQVYKIQDDGSWKQDDLDKGIWLSRKEIKLLTLWRTSEENEHVR